MYKVDNIDDLLLVDDLVNIINTFKLFNKSIYS